MGGMSRHLWKVQLQKSHTIIDISREGASRRWAQGIYKRTNNNQDNVQSILSKIFLKRKTNTPQSSSLPPEIKDMFE